MSRQTRNPPRSEAGDRQAKGLGDFTHRVLIAAFIFAIVFLAWHLRHTIILAFAAVVVAAILLAATDLTRRFTPFGHRWSLAVSGLLILLLIGVVLWVGWPSIQRQSTNLLQQMPQAVQSIEERFGLRISNLFGQMGDAWGGALGRILSDVATMVQTTVTAITGLILVIIAGAFLAANPGLYRTGFLLLVPPQQDERVGRALDKTGRALKLWLVGQLLSMFIVGLLVGLGAWAIGLPSPLALALFAFLVEFVPLIGPFVGAAPGLLLALGQDWSTLLWTTLLYLTIQQLESNLITPTVQREMVRIPQALFMLSVVAMGALFGILGVVLSGPLTVTAFVLIRTLYVEEALGEEVSDDGGI